VTFPKSVLLQHFRKILVKRLIISSAMTVGLDGFVSHVRNHAIKVQQEIGYCESDFFSSAVI
jgi:hypothetical protein